MKKLLLLLLVAAAVGGGYVYSQRDGMLLEAAAKGDSDSIGRMLRIGADVDARDADGRTPLILAAAAGHQEVARQLLDAGATRDVTDNSQHSPAWHAFQNGHFDLAKQLRVLRDVPSPGKAHERQTASQTARRRSEASDTWMEESQAFNREKREAYEEYLRTRDRIRYDERLEDIRKREEEAYERYQDATPDLHPTRKKD